MLGSDGWLVALALVALAVAPLLASRGAPRTLAGASALVGVLVYAPGVLDLINAVTGSGPILWRMLYVAPVPVLVGLLVALPWGTGERAADAAAGPAGRGVRRARCDRRRLRPRRPPGLVAHRPRWPGDGHRRGPSGRSTSPRSDDVEILAEARTSAARSCCRRSRMKVLTMYTTDAFPVVPRDWFIQNMREPKASNDARRVLAEIADGVGPFVSEGNAARRWSSWTYAGLCRHEREGRRPGRRALRGGGLRHAARGRLDDLPGRGRSGPSAEPRPCTLRTADRPAPPCPRHVPLHA